MPLERLVDNDVLIKGAFYRLLQPICMLVSAPLDVGILGTARFVVRSRLERKQGMRDRPGALNAWHEFLGQVTELEPTSEELELATQIEEGASRLGVSLDGGESQLCSIAIIRGIPIVVTGDKRAIQGMESVRTSVEALKSLSKRVRCLEQLVQELLADLEPRALRSLICAEPTADRTLSICFECGRAENEDEAFYPVGLTSYIEDLRQAAPHTLGI